MSNIDIISMAVRNLFKRKLRTFLTILGVVIGTCAIIIMISLGIGMNENYIKSLNQMGDLTTVNVSKPYNYSMMGGGGYVAISSSSSSGGSGSNELILDDSTIAEFKRIPGVLTATAFVDIGLKAVSGKYQTWISIRGIDREAMELLGYIPQEGRLMTEEDRYGVVFGYSVPFDFRNPRDRFDTWQWWSPYDGNPDTRIPKINIFEDKIQVSYDMSFGEKNPIRDQYYKPVKPYTINVVGWLPYKGGTDYYAYMALEEVQKIKAEQEKWESSRYQQQGGSNNNKKAKGYDNAVVKFTDIKYVEDGLNQIRSMGYEAYGMIESLRSMQEMTKSLQMLLGAIGGVALFVAAIGISNTMIMSIYERTKEIGVMKVIGASLKDIKRLFLLEAAMIGFFGGAVGIGVSLLISMVINKVGISFFDMVSYGANQGGVSSVPMWLCLASLGGAAAIGTLSGYFPARRAMKLSALSAIRME